MYITINETKLSVISVTSDANVLNLAIKKEYDLQETYNLFKDNDLSTITTYDDVDDEPINVYLGYSQLDGFSFLPSTGQYNITLVKFDVNNVKQDVDQLSKDLQNISDAVTSMNHSIKNMENGELTKQQSFALSVVATSFTDEQAVQCSLLFDEWNANGHAYKKDDRFRYKEGFYKVLQDHNSQENWAPDTASSLYVQISNPNIEWPEWKQPTGSQDAYNAGDKVTYKGKKYTSKIDANTWSPEDYPNGWTLVEE